jgi:hypothetical protein
MATAEERFWAKVARDDSEDGCWLWTAAVDRVTGYGRFVELEDAITAAVELRNRLFTHNDADRVMAHF